MVRNNGSVFPGLLQQTSRGGSEGVLGAWLHRRRSFHYTATPYRPDIVGIGRRRDDGGESERGLWGNGQDLFHQHGEKAMHTTVSRLPMNVEYDEIHCRIYSAVPLPFSFVYLPNLFTFFARRRRISAQTRLKIVFRAGLWFLPINSIPTTG